MQFFYQQKTDKSSSFKTYLPGKEEPPSSHLSQPTVWMPFQVDRMPFWLSAIILLSAGTACLLARGLQPPSSHI